MRVLSIAILVSLLSTSAVLPGQSRQENLKSCSNADNPEGRIAGCSALIQSNQEKGTDLAKAYYDRALGYAHKADYDHAIRDYHQAVRINPDYADAYYGRGWAYPLKGDHHHAIQDFNQLLRLKPSFADAFYDRGLPYADKSDYARAMFTKYYRATTQISFDIWLIPCYSFERLAFAPLRFDRPCPLTPSPPQSLPQGNSVPTNLSPFQ